MTAPMRWPTIANFFPITPKTKKPAMIWGAAKTTQPRPSCQATPGPDTNELTDP